MLGFNAGKCNLFVVYNDKQEGSGQRKIANKNETYAVLELFV
jgi:hypothetical protein